MKTIPYSLEPRKHVNTFQKIPRIIYQTFKTNEVPDVLFIGVETIINLNPECQYEFYDDKRMESFVHNFDCTDFSFNNKTLSQAFNDINPGAGKADIFRYLIIYQNGGIYLDLDTKCLQPFSKFIDSDSDIITSIAGISHNYDNSYDKWYHLFPQWYLMYSPKCTIMKKIIEVCVKSIITRTPVPNSQDCLNLLERYTGVCVSNYVFRNIFNFKNIDQEKRLKTGKNNIKHDGNKYMLNILASKSNIVNNCLVSKHLTVIEHQKELRQINIEYWQNQQVFKE